MKTKQARKVSTNLTIFLSEFQGDLTPTLSGFTLQRDFSMYFISKHRKGSLEKSAPPYIEKHAMNSLAMSIQIHGDLTVTEFAPLWDFSIYFTRNRR